MSTNFTSRKDREILIKNKIDFVRKLLNLKVLFLIDFFL